MHHYLTVKDLPKERRYNMCLLMYSPKGKTPTRRELENSCDANPHGFGYAIVDGTKLIVGKSLVAEDMINEFISYKKKNPNAIGLFHARYATHGEKTVENCHPFYIGNDNQTILAHNGILDIPTFDHRSDTRVFAEDLFPTYDNVGGLDNPVVFNAVQTWATGSKIIVLTVNPKYKKNVYILNKKLGHKDSKGNWWSNYGYCEPKYSYTTPYTYQGYYDFDTKGVYQNTNKEKEVWGFECESCLQWVDETFAYDNFYICEFCDCCFMCIKPSIECKCEGDRDGSY
jgi:glutamine amidotransferase